MRSCQKSVFPGMPRIPSVWDHELVVRLLGAVDRSSAKGKRDYAILLLACRLGLRAGDIRTLKLDQLHWEDSPIEITQSKTGTPLSLPLTDEVGEALIDYLRSGRPQTAHREVFLKVNPPFDPFRGQQPTPHCHVLAPAGRDHDFGLHKSEEYIPFATLWRLGFWRRERRFPPLRRSWGIPVWNRHGFMRKRMWKPCGAWRWILRR